MLASSWYMEDFFESFAFPDEVVRIWNVGFKVLRIIQTASENQ
jgi:hypothetical protein